MVLMAPLDRPGYMVQVQLAVAAISVLINANEYGMFWPPYLRQAPTRSGVRQGTERGKGMRREVSLVWVAEALPSTLRVQVVRSLEPSGCLHCVCVHVPEATTQQGVEVSGEASRSRQRALTQHVHSTTHVHPSSSPVVFNGASSCSQKRPISSRMKSTVSAVASAPPVTSSFL